jgi:hypothetical protein
MERLAGGIVGRKRSRGGKTSEIARGVVGKRTKVPGW